MRPHPADHGGFPVPRGRTAGTTGLSPAGARSAADREIVGGPLGVAASMLPGVECADLCGQKQIAIAPIVAKLGQPPEPAEIARRLAPSGPTNDRSAMSSAEPTRRQSGRGTAATPTTWTGAFGCGLIEIGPMSGGATRRYGSGHIYEGLNEALREIADSYAALEWSRSRSEWGRGPVTTPAERRGRAGGPNRRRHRHTEERDETGGAPARTEPAMEPSSPPPRAPGRQGARHASLDPHGRVDVQCRRSCSLRYRACLARCRDQPISGGGYDACSYECSDGSLTCRGACGASRRP